MIKTLHIATAVISICLFVLRGVWLLTAAATLRRRWVKIAPHLNDTLLLATAVVLAARSEQYPLVNAWLTVKVTALLVYIGLGMALFRVAATNRSRLLLLLAAMLVFAFIVSVAVSRQPLGFLAWLS